MRQLFSHKSIIISIMAIFLCSACTLMTVKEGTKEIESLNLLQGKIQNNSGKKGQVYVLLLQHSEASLDVIGYYPVNNDGSYAFYEYPVEYYVVAFVDQSGDGKFQPGEPANYLQYKNNLPKKITLSSTTTINLSINDNFTTPLIPFNEKMPERLDIVGKIIDIKDERFSKKNASLGLWQPLTFLEKQYAGLFMLQTYDPTKMPIIFIHGVEGTPAQFSHIIDSLDKQRFQPWVLYYPSGLRLEMISNFLLKAMNELQQQYDFSTINIGAHSAGGLVLRSFVQKNSLVKNTLKINKAITINSPLMGMDSAASGVKKSPIVIPVWRDIATNSQFLTSLHKQPWPKDTNYYLFFSYLDGRDGDGVVPMPKQLSPSLQHEATKIIGFNAEHSQVLATDELSIQLNKVLN